jgi:hypothetical protein
MHQSQKFGIKCLKIKLTENGPKLLLKAHITLADWSKGSKIIFLGPNPETGKEGGMVSRIKDNKLHEFISIEHLGEVHDGVEDTTSDRVKDWAGALENYTFADKDGKTELVVDLDINEEFKEMFEGMWPKALQKLKSLCEE